MGGVGKKPKKKIHARENVRKKNSHARENVRKKKSCTRWASFSYETIIRSAKVLK